METFKFYFSDHIEDKPNFKRIGITFDRVLELIENKKIDCSSQLYDFLDAYRADKLPKREDPFGETPDYEYSLDFEWKDNVKNSEIKIMVNIDDDFSSEADVLEDWAWEPDIFQNPNEAKKWLETNNISEKEINDTAKFLGLKKNDPYKVCDVYEYFKCTKIEENMRKDLENLAENIAEYAMNNTQSMKGQ